MPLSLLKFMVLDLQTSQDSGGGQSNTPASAVAPVKFSSQISTAQSNFPSQFPQSQSKSSSSSTAVASVSSSSHQSTSLSNSEEASLCVRVVETLVIQARASGYASIGSIGIITFYADQVGEIKRKLQLSGLLTATGSAGASAAPSVSASATNYLPGIASTAGGNISAVAPGGLGAQIDPATTLDIEVGMLTCKTKRTTDYSNN